MPLKKLTHRQALKVAAEIPPRRGWPKGVAVPSLKGQPIYSPQHDYPNPNNTGVAALEIAHDEKQWEAFQNRSMGSSTYAQDLQEYVRQTDRGTLRKVTDSSDENAARLSPADERLSYERKVARKQFTDWWNEVLNGRG